MRLTDITIRSLPLPAKGQKTYFDDTMRSFGCRVSQGGTKSFVVQSGEDRQLTTIGRYPIITLAEARGEAKRLLAERTLGKHRPKTIRWEEAEKLFLAACEEKNRPSTIGGYKRLLGRHFAFNGKKLGEITYEDIERRLARIDAPGERNHALVAVKIFLGWAQKPPRRFIATNPCEGMVPSKRPHRKRVLTDSELAAVVRVAFDGTDYHSIIVALLTITGQRRGEIGGLERAWINGDERTITLLETITKNKTEHTFPFGDLAAGLLAKVPELESPYLFPAAREHVRGKPTTIFNGWQKAKVDFDKRLADAGYKVAPWTLHDLRRTFGTKLAEMKVLPHVVERLLNHKLGSISNSTSGTVSAVAEVYNRATYMPEMREAVTLWESRLAELLARS